MPDPGAVSRPLVHRSAARLNPDPTRVIARLFVPGHEFVVDTESRATGVLGRLLALPEDVVEATLEGVRESFGPRHRDLDGILARHYRRIAHRLPDGPPLTAARAGLLGAVFTHEFSPEGAALFNPSAVAHPDQSGLRPGQCRFVLSLRAVGEGHVSSVSFRSGVLGPDGELSLDDAAPHAEEGEVTATTYPRAAFAETLRDYGADAESARFLVSRLPEVFAPSDLEAALSALSGQRLTRHGAAHTDTVARQIASCSYRLDFPADTDLGERVLWPQAPSESHGIEDARWVRFVDGATVRYLATYTAFDGSQISSGRIETDDFRSFRMSPLAGPAAVNKGMALFPRRVGGRHLALSRWDRENCWLANSDDGLLWNRAATLHRPVQPWEVIQTGNCGPPIETEAGWLVLTHGVGPMRQYAIGALLLDLDDPARVVGDLRVPLLSPTADERDGYVPNVVYSCGALRHDDQVLLPYGASDSSVRFAVLDLPGLLERLTTG